MAQINNNGLKFIRSYQNLKIVTNNDLQVSFGWTKVLSQWPTPNSRPIRKKQTRGLLVQLSKARPMSIASQLQEEWTPVTPVLSRTVRWILARNGHIAAQKPALNKRQLRNCVAYAKAGRLDGRLDSRKVVKNDFFR